jgi:23S rRNA (guanosine2251-2'-O)-methyltransferase
MARDEAASRAPSGANAPSPRDRFLTVYGRQPVLEALHDPTLEIEQVFVDEGLRGPLPAQIRDLADRRGVPVRMVTRAVVTKFSQNGRQHQGVAADVRAPGLRGLDEWLGSLSAAARACVLVLDGVATPANVGMIIRSATASGIDALIVPTKGVAELGPLVVKASAGTAFRAPLVRARRAEDALAGLRSLDFEIVGLAASAGEPLWDATFPPRVAFVLGAESVGLSPAVAELVTRRIRIPMARAVESLNVAAAGSVLCFELARRRGAPGEGSVEPR